MQVEALIDKILTSKQVEDINGNLIKVEGNIDKFEGEYIYNIIKEIPSITKTLEIGCGYGISSLYICAALWNRPNAEHIIIDPLQNISYFGVGRYNLDKVGCNFYQFLECPSEYALPELVSKEENNFDLILVDGWHSFDHVFVDTYYANKLLKIDGFLILDDCRIPSVAKVVKYYNHHPSYRFHSYTRTDNLSRKARLAQRACQIIPKFINENLFPLQLSELVNRLRNPSMLAFKKINSVKLDSRWYKRF